MIFVGAAFVEGALIFAIGFCCGRGYAIRDEIRWLKQQIRGEHD